MLLTTRELILKLIRDTINTRGYPPTIRELMDMAGLNSPSSVQHHLVNLERDGLISRGGRGLSRTLQLIEQNGE